MEIMTNDGGEESESRDGRSCLDHKKEAEPFVTLRRQRHDMLNSLLITNWAHLIRHAVPMR